MGNWLPINFKNNFFHYNLIIFILKLIKNINLGK